MAQSAVLVIGREGKISCLRHYNYEDAAHQPDVATIRESKWHE